NPGRVTRPPPPANAANRAGHPPIARVGASRGAGYPPFPPKSGPPRTAISIFDLSRQPAFRLAEEVRAPGDTARRGALGPLQTACRKMNQCCEPDGVASRLRTAS